MEGKQHQDYNIFDKNCLPTLDKLFDNKLMEWSSIGHLIVFRAAGKRWLVYAIDNQLLGLVGEEESKKIFMPLKDKLTSLAVSADCRFIAVATIRPLEAICTP